MKQFYSSRFSFYYIAVELHCFPQTGVSVYYPFHLIYINEVRLNNRIASPHITVRFRKTKAPSLQDYHKDLISTFPKHFSSKTL